MKSDAFTREAYLAKYPEYDTRKTRYWREAILPGCIGRIHKNCSAPFGGKMVSFVGRWGGSVWVKLLEPAGNYPRGQVFAYMLKWVDWSTDGGKVDGNSNQVQMSKVQR